jgi:hypothetical protein
MRRIYLLIPGAVFLASCTHTRALDPSAEHVRAVVNERAERSTATLTLATGERFRAQSLHVAPDLVTWMDAASGEDHAIPSSDVISVQFRGRARGAFEGLGIGMLVGGGAGALLGAATYEGDTGEGGAGWCILVCSPSDAALLLGTFMALVGGALGLPIGAGVGSRAVYRIVTPAKSRGAQAPVPSHYPMDATPRDGRQIAGREGGA